MGANGNKISMLGKRIGALTVIRQAPSIRRTSDGHRQAAWLCQCDCGEKTVVRGRWLREGKKKACGVNGHRFSSDEVATTRDERRCYNAMLQRCYNPKASGYKHYGARGIAVCQRWRDDVVNFLSDMGPRPSRKHSIDRYPDRNGGYEPGNCRWATEQEQALNRDIVIRVTFNGKEITIAEYAKKLGINAQMIRRRLAKGWSVQNALLTPSRQYNNRA